MATFDIVAAVASDEPQTALNAPQAITEAMARPPRTLPSRELAAAKRPWLTPEIVRRLPIRMNSGTTDSV